MCSGLTAQTYEGKLKEVGLVSLSDRRLRADLVQVWKILHAKDKVNESRLFSRMTADGGRETRSTASGLNLKIPRANLEIRRNIFSNRTPRTWNQIPENIKTAPSLENFKCGIDAWIEQNREPIN